MADSTQNAPLIHPVAPMAVPPGGSGMEAGSVVSRSGEAMLVACQRGVVRATRAAGCLLEPEPQDRVLLAVLPDGTAWVLSVLERSAAPHADTAPATVRLPAHSLIASETLQMTSRELCCVAEKLTLKGDDVAVEGAQVRVDASLLALGGTLLVRTFEAMHTVAKRSSEHILHVNHWYAALRETVRGLVERKAGRVRLESETGLRVRAAQADIKARTVLDLDAEHIRLG